ncbi:MAG TPA: hypothetical protein VD931_14210, partial [Baekduia sp.]|nr:hypothetical protein [Baekduia sp.]
MGGHGPGGSRRARRALALAAIAAGVGAPGALAAPVDLGPGRDPFAVIAPDGTAYVAFNGTETTAALRFCRLPRGAGACAAGGAIPTPGTSLTRPFVVVDGATVKVLSYRYGEGVPGFSAVYLFTSTDGGASFGPGRQVGTQNIHTAVAGPGTGVSIASSAEGGGGKFQRVPTDPDSPKVEQVATLAPAHAYLGAVGLLDAGTPVVVFSDASGNAITRRFTGSGSINDAASWTAAQPIGHATASHLAGGPRGLFLLNAAADGRLELRRHDGTAFAPPVPVPDGTGDTVHAHLTQDAGGRLHAVWPRLDGSLHYAASDDGTGFTRGVVVRDADGVTDLRAAAAADHEGVAIWQTRGASRVRLAPIPPPPGPPPDAEPPDTLITAGPGPGSTVTSAATFEFSSTEDGSRFECSVKPAQLDDQGGPSWGPCASPYRTPGFGFAYLRFRVRAIDGAGNADPSPATVEYFSDPVPYGNVRVRGIDLFQLVQPNSGAQMFGYAASGATAPFPRFCGGGTPTGGTIATSGPGAGRFCQLLGNPRRVTYQGVPLDTSKPATAIVYVGMEGAATSDAKQPLDVTLVATAPNGRQIGPALVERITNPPVSGTSWVTGNERRNALAQRHGVRFAIPSAWLGSIAVNLRATVSFAAGTRSWNEAECYNNACAADNAFELVAVRKAALPPVLITPLLLRSQANQVVPGGFPAPESVFDVVRHVVPGGDRIRLRWYGATLDITTESGLTVQAVPPLPIIGAGFFLCSNGAVYGPPTQTTAAGATRQCRIDAVSAVVDQWVADNPPRHVGGDGRTVQAYDIAAGIHSYAGEPGWQWGGNLRNVDRTTVAPVPRLTLTCCTRPLTAATHELLHAYTAPHAGQSCPGTAAGAAQAGEAWAGDNNGRLQGTRFDRRQTGAPHIGFDDAVTPQLYDVMSYCAANNDTGEANSDGARGDAWISPRNWNRAVGELQALAGRVGLSRAAGAPTLGKRRLPRAAQAQTRPRTPFAVGQAGSADGRILRVLAPDGSDAIPASDPASPLRLRSLAADGRVLQDAGVVVNVSSESPPGSPGTFVA